MVRFKVSTPINRRPFLSPGMTPNSGGPHDIFYEEPASNGPSPYGRSPFGGSAGGGPPYSPYTSPYTSPYMEASYGGLSNGPSQQKKQAWGQDGTTALSE